MPPGKTGSKNLFDFRDFGDVYNKVEEDKLTEPLSMLQSTNFTTSKIDNYVGENQKVYDAIKNRLMNFTPQILLGDHIVHSWERVKKLNASENNKKSPEGKYRRLIVHRNILNGIDFIIEDYDKLLCTIRNARADISKPGFVEGSKKDFKKHWALALSFAATDGIGFREIFRPQIVERPLENFNRMPFDNRFGRDYTVDISSLHLAISNFKDFPRCNIHIDNLTVTLGGITNEIGISPTSIGHIVNELLFKTYLQRKLPNWLIDAFDISLLDPHTGFLNAGIGATIINKPNFKWTINYSVGLNNSTHPEWSGSFKFEKSVGTGIVIRF